MSRHWCIKRWESPGRLKHQLEVWIDEPTGMALFTPRASTSEAAEHLKILSELAEKAAAELEEVRRDTMQTIVTI
ncbi:MAG: hypothetical protein Q9162_006110, partial [Coniocarpon cinnabarinum]